MISLQRRRDIPFGGPICWRRAYEVSRHSHSGPWWTIISWSGVALSTAAGSETTFSKLIPTVVGPLWVKCTIKCREEFPQESDRKYSTKIPPILTNLPCLSDHNFQEQHWSGRRVPSLMSWCSLVLLVSFVQVCIASHAVTCCEPLQRQIDLCFRGS